VFNTADAVYCCLHLHLKFKLAAKAAKHAKEIKINQKTQQTNIRQIKYQFYNSGNLKPPQQINP